MKSIKNKRLSYGYTQQQLAEILGVSQQTVARWESGKGEPKLSQIRDIAICLGTSAEELLKGDCSKPLNKQERIQAVKERFFGDDAFWGHVGLRLNNQDKSKWYPISRREMSSIYRKAQDESAHAWVNFETMNYRYVAIPISKINCLTLLDDAAGHDENDWEVPLDSYQPWPEDVYDCLDEIEFLTKETHSFSKKLISLTKDYYKDILKNGYTDIYEFLDATRIHLNDGATINVYIEEQKLADLYMDIDDNYTLKEKQTFIFDENDLGKTCIVSKDLILLIDAPLRKIKTGFALNEKEYERSLPDV